MGMGGRPMMASDIVDHLDKVLAAQPQPVQDAVDHAHGVLGLQSPVTMADNAPETSMDAPASASAPEAPQSISPSSGGVSPIVSVGSPSDAQPLPTPKPTSASPDLSSEGAINPTSAPVALPNPHMQNLERMTAEGPGVNKIHNPLLKGLAIAGDAVGSGLFPEFTRFIPGFSAHHQQLLNEEEGQLGQEQKSQKTSDESAQSKALTEHEQAETANLPVTAELQKAETQNYLTEAEARKNPVLKPFAEPVIDPNDARKTPRIGYYDEHNPGKVVYGPEIGAKPVDKQPTNLFEFALKQHPDWTAEQARDFESKPIDKATADALNQNYAPIAEKYGLPKNQFREGMPSSEVTQQMSSLNASVGKQQGAQNITINQTKADNAGTARRDAETSKEYLKTHQRLTTAFDALQKQSDALEQAEREIGGTAPGQAVGIMKTIVGLAGGQGSGVRLTTAELNGLTKARGYGDDFQAWLQKFGDGKQLSPGQVSEIKEILSDVSGRASQKRELYLDSLDKLNGARSVDDVRKIESDFNHAIAGGATPKPQTQAEYDAIKPGTVYIDTDGQQKKKK